MILFKKQNEKVLSKLLLTIIININKMKKYFNQNIVHRQLAMTFFHFSGSKRKNDISLEAIHSETHFLTSS